MRRLSALTATLATVVLAGSLAACGSSSTTSTSPSKGASSSATASNAKHITVTFSGNTVTPIAETLSVSVGQDVILDVTAAKPGEIHVHSTPEQHVEYTAGTTHHDLGSFNFPTQIQIESHTLDKTILFLQVQ